MVFVVTKPNFTTTAECNGIYSAIYRNQIHVELKILTKIKLSVLYTHILLIFTGPVMYIVPLILQP